VSIENQRARIANFEPNDSKNTHASQQIALKMEKFYQGRIGSAEEHLARSDPNMARLIDRFGPCPLLTPSRPPFDILASSIVGQQLSTKAADTIRKRLANRLQIDRPFHPAHFVRRRPSTLQGCGLSANKSAYVLGLARAIHAGTLQFDDFVDKEDEEVIRALVQHPGIGRWTAEMFLISGLGRLDVLAIDDAGLRRATRSLYNLKRPLTEQKFRRIAEPWRPFRSVASWYLWEFADNPLRPETA